MSNRRSLDDVEQFYEYGIYAPTRTLYMGSEGADEEGETGTDFLMAERMVKGLHVLDMQSDKPITIVMNNLGGCVYHGMAIYDAIKACRSEVTIRATGHAMSMGSIILQAADHRVLTPNSRFMIHYGTNSMPHIHTKIFLAWAREGEKFDRMMEDLYLERIHTKHPDFSRARLQKMLNFDTILTAQETIDLGLADAITE